MSDDECIELEKLHDALDVVRASDLTPIARDAMVRADEALIRLSGLATGDRRLANWTRPA